MHFRLSVFVGWILSCVVLACGPVAEPKTTALSNTDTTWQQLSLREKIGQLVCLSYEPATVARYGGGSVDSFLVRYPVGALFLANWTIAPSVAPDSVQATYRALVSAFSAASKHPMLFCEDFESGLGPAMPGYTQLPAEMALGAAASTTHAYNYGNILGSEARSIGLNWLLNPVADLNLNSNNFLTNVRSTGDNAQLAQRLLPPQIRGMQQHGVAATAKHFPGDGTDCINQHFCTSTMKLDYNEWLQHHGAVFQAAIDSGVLSIMAGHISFPAFQKKQHNGEYLPATLSDELITELLKKQLHFPGVVVSDALNMAGISGFYPSPLETQVECFKAGVDILLWPQLDIIDTLEARILRHEIPMERLDDAVARIWNMKRKLGLFDSQYRAIQPITTEQLHQNNQQAYQLAQNAITLLSNKNQLLPISPDTSPRLLLVFVSETEQAANFSVLKKELEAKGFQVDTRNNLSYFAHGASLDSLARQYPKILFVFHNSPGNPWGSLAHKGDQALSMWSANMLPPSQVISIAFGDPYKNIEYMPRTWCRINCYNADPNTQLALARALVGEVAFAGQSPVGSSH